MPVDLNLVAEAHAKVAERAEKRGKTPFFKFQPGENRLRILPPFGTSTKFWVECRTAYQVGPSKNTVIPRAQFKLPCPYTEYLEALHKKGDQASKDEASRIYPKQRFYIWIIERGAEDKGPQLLDANQFVFRDITGIMADPDYGDITDPTKGTDLKITYVPKDKTANGFPDWQVLPTRNASSLGTAEQMKAWMETDLNTEFSIGVPSDELYIKAVLDGTTDDYFKSLGGGSKPKEVASNAPTPTPPQTVSPSAVEMIITYSGDPDTRFWVVDPANKQTVEMTARTIVSFLKQGNDDLPIMAYDQQTPWTTPYKAGFKKEAPAPKAATPPPPPSSPAAPPNVPSPPPGPTSAGPTAGNGVQAAPPITPVVSGDSDEAALMAKLEEIRKKRGQNGGSVVSDELKAALGK